MLLRLAVLLLGLSLSGLGLASDAAERFVAGQHYFAIDPPQPTGTGGKVEVLEIFSYRCGACASFQPYADQLRAALPETARFDYAPAQFQPGWDVFARGYYAAETLGVLPQSHQALFDALWRDKKNLATLDDLAGFYSAYGVKAGDFLEVAASFAVNTKVRRAAALVPKLQVESTPTVVVNGKYRMTAKSAGGYPQLIELVNFLVAQESAASSAKL